MTKPISRLTKDEFNIQEARERSLAGVLSSHMKNTDLVSKELRSLEIFVYQAEKLVDLWSKIQKDAYYDQLCLMKVEIRELEGALIALRRKIKFKSFKRVHEEVEAKALEDRKVRGEGPRARKSGTGSDVRRTRKVIVSEG